MSEINATNGAGRPKPGPKGKVLEPYSREVLLMTREGKSMQDIVNWLADPPREVAITRQAVHLWVKARIQKLVKLNAVFANTGVGGPFQQGEMALISSSDRMCGPDPPRLSTVRPALGLKSEMKPSPKRIDVSEFMVDEFELTRELNPLLSKS